MFRGTTFFQLLLVGCLALGTSSLLSEDAKVMELGKLTYQVCATCHAPDGKGMKTGELQLGPSLWDSDLLKKDRKDLLAAAVLKGILKGPGDTKYIQAMLPMESALNNEQIAAVLSYVRIEFGNKEGVIMPQEVGQWRKDFAEQKSPWDRKALYEQLNKKAKPSAPKLISNLRYSVFKGSWKKLPDFSKLEPVAEGELKNGIISLDPLKKLKISNNYAVVFEGDFTVPKTEEYHFTLASDDGSALAIDGEGLIDNDGIHPVKVKSAKEQLEKGEHTIKLLFFQGGGGAELYLKTETPSFAEVALTKKKWKGGGAAKNYEPILLSARQPGEAIVHRAFLPDAKPRAIGVGYPGRVNLCWDADVLNLAYIWRGEFMDTSGHWNGRGSASAPQGKDRFKTGHGLPFQILESLDEAWEPFSESRIRYERDTRNPEKEIVFNLKHPDYQFKGYRLDKKRFPTFLYTYRKMEVTDFFQPEEIEGVESIVRTIQTSGNPDENTYLRIANTGSLTLSEGWYDVGGQVKIKVEGAETDIRKTNGANELLVKLTGDKSETKVIYRWSEPLSD